MTNISANSTFTFKGVTLQTGDHIAFTSSSIPLPINVAMDACFTHVDENGNLNVFSTLLAPFQHNGEFTAAEIDKLEVVRCAKKSVWVEARNENLEHGQLVEAEVNGKKIQGELIGAFDGIVCAWANNNFLTGGSHFFKPVSS